MGWVKVLRAILREELIGELYERRPDLVSVINSMHMQGYEKTFTREYVQVGVSPIERWATKAYVEQLWKVGDAIN